MTYADYLTTLREGAKSLRQEILRDIDRKGYTAAQIWCASKNPAKVHLTSVEKGIAKLRHQEEYEFYSLDIDSGTIRTIAEGIDALENGSDCR